MSLSQIRKFPGVPIATWALCVSSNCSKIFIILESRSVAERCLHVILKFKLIKMIVMICDGEPGSKIEMFHDRNFAQENIILADISGNFRNSFSNIEAIYSYFAWEISSLQILKNFMANLPWHFRSIIFRVRKLRNVDFPDPDEPIIAVNVPFHSLSYFQVKGQGHNFY